MNELKKVIIHLCGITNFKCMLVILTVTHLTFHSHIDKIVARAFSRSNLGMW